MGQEHILVVEDDKEILEGIKIYLKNQGYVVFCLTGFSGLESCFAFICL